MTTTVSDTVADSYPHYASAFAALSADGPGPLSALRQRGWNAFQDLGLPTARRGNEPWKYTNVAPIARESFGFVEFGSAATGVSIADLRAVAPWNEQWTTLAMVDGVFVPELSGSTRMPGSGNNGRMIIGSINQAAQVSPDLCDNLLASLASPEDEGFTAVNTAFLRDGVAISVPAGEDGGVVNIVHLTTGRQQPRVTYPRTLINAEANARVTVIETFIGPDETRYLTNAVMEAQVGEGASIEHYRLLLEGGEAYHVGTSRVVQAKDSRFSSVSVANGAALGRNDFGVLLDGAGAECVLNGLYLTKENQHIDNYINIDHAEPHGTSRMFYKGILDGKSRAVFGGNVLVRKDAQKTDAQQTDKNLLLSPDAEVDSKPSLLIYADDVKCGHGATAGHIDADTVFYMRSRGLDLPTASRILIQAFAREIIDTVALEPLREFIDLRFEDAIPDADISLPLGGLP